MSSGFIAGIIVWFFATVIVAIFVFGILRKPHQVDLSWSSAERIAFLLREKAARG